MRICVYGASSDAIDSMFIRAGETLGERMAERGHELVFGGGAHGMMGAVARGMTKKGGRIIGVAPSFFQVDGVLYEQCDEFLYTETMRERKQLMEDRADAFIMTAGGIGTLEEFFEILTLRQLERHKKPIAVLNTDGYYDSVTEMLKTAVERRFMREANLTLFGTFHDPDALLDYLENDGGETVDVQKLKFF
ncbi:MAG: TIGR00730 family Rossman fold protein [Oscillospiraceae bacterium]|nr:TIGR00730 family Rossman fold protein [Oscillospiraceae bacterium]MBR2366352.1 TIGR00730 family Rossman fold protein [Oscillospiraceae bacterium]MBR2978070.1 TIGR00730 family Rossman fold protein [Oscillospiraceae bacterium]